MTEYVTKNGKRLRTGITTGACAAAAAKAGAEMILSHKTITSVSVKAKTGVELRVDIVDIHNGRGAVSCAVIKDAGDDPDTTDGLSIVATVSLTPSGISIDGGEGVGRVTKPGLKIEAGKAAINPVPLQMIADEVREICRRYLYDGGVKVIISVPGGEEAAKRTMNSRLGIMGGISILGTTGIVEPMSDKAVIDTIKADIDVQLASGNKNLLVTPGNYGRDFAKDALGLDINEAVKCSNYIGEMLDHACTRGAESVTLIGHAGKLIKLAGGIMHTHSKTADCRMEIIAAHCAMAGADSKVIREIMSCVTVDAALQIIRTHEFYNAVRLSLRNKIGFHLRERTKGALLVKYIVFTQEYGVLVNSTTEEHRLTEV